MTLAVHHLAVQVSDLSRAMAFYGDLLGLPLQKTHYDDKGAIRSYWLALNDGAFLAVEVASRLGPPPDHAVPRWHCVALTIDVASREYWKNRLNTAGFLVHRESDYTLYTHDPDGNLIGLSHYPVSSAG